jgi:hypothetical protein
MNPSGKRLRASLMWFEMLGINQLVLKMQLRNYISSSAELPRR